MSHSDHTPHHHRVYNPGHPAVARNGVGLAALVVGLGGMAFGVIPLTGFVAILAALVAIPLALAGRARVRRGEATNGKTAIFGLLAGVAALALGIWGMTILFSATDKLVDDLQKIAPPTSVQTPAVLQPGQVTGDGVLVVGADIQPGTYKTVGPAADSVIPNCYWARLKDTAGDLSAVRANGNLAGAGTVTIRPTDKAFETRGCAPWTKVG